MEIYSVPPFSTPLRYLACRGPVFFFFWRVPPGIVTIHVVECYSLLAAVDNPVRKNQASKVEH